MADGSQLKGLFRGGGVSLLGVQCLAALTITVWAMCTCLLTLWIFHSLSQTACFRWLVLRPTKAAEELGFDQTEHNIRRESKLAAPAQTVEVPKLKDNSKWRKVQGLDVKSLRSLKNIKATTASAAPAAPAAPGSVSSTAAAHSAGTASVVGEEAAGVVGSGPHVGAAVGSEAKLACTVPLQSLEFRAMTSDEMAAAEISRGHLGQGAIPKPLTPTLEEAERSEPEEPSGTTPHADGRDTSEDKREAAAAAVLARLERAMRGATVAQQSPPSGARREEGGEHAETVSAAMMC